MPDDVAFNLVQVLWDERKVLKGVDFAQLDIDDVAATDLAATYRILNSDKRYALCLSGGGIRSAAFDCATLCGLSRRVEARA